MSVPEASVYKNRRVVVRKKNVRRAKMTSVIFSESESSSVKRAPQKNFGFCVFAADFRHIQAALFRCQSVHSFMIILPAENGNRNGGFFPARLET